MFPTVCIRLLPDGSGHVRIHWFQKIAGGPIKTAGRSDLAIVFPGSEGRIACMPHRTVTHQWLKSGEYEILHHTDDPRAATCPECMATKEFKGAMAEMGLEVPEKNPLPELSTGKSKSSTEPPKRSFSTE
jgi:hypothetical protein